MNLGDFVGGVRVGGIDLELEQEWLEGFRLGRAAPVVYSDSSSSSRRGGRLSRIRKRCLQHTPFTTSERGRVARCKMQRRLHEDIRQRCRGRRRDASPDVKPIHAPCRAVERSRCQVIAVDLAGHGVDTPDCLEKGDRRERVEAPECRSQLGRLCFVRAPETSPPSAMSPATVATTDHVSERRTLS